MGVVDGRVDGDRSGGTSVLVNLLVQDGLKLVVAHLGLVEDDMVVSGTSGTLEGGVRAEVKVVLVRLSAASLDQGSGEGVAVTVALLGEEANVVALAADDNHERNVEVGVGGLQQGLHVSDLLLQDVGVLLLRDTVTEVENALGE